MRVLLADNKPEVRAALRLLFEQECDLTVVGEASGSEALLDRALTAEPDLIVLDWDLSPEGPSPVVTGASLVGDLRARLPQVGVVAVGRWPEVRRAALEAGAHAFVSKVEPPECVLTAVRRAAAG